MIIRLSKKHYNSLKNLSNKNKDEFVIDDTCNEPEISYKINEKEIKLWIYGYNPVKNYLIYGYNRIIKKCPYKFFTKCLGEKCQFYFIENMTGDCVKIWDIIYRNK